MHPHSIAHISVWADICKENANVSTSLKIPPHSDLSSHRCISKQQSKHLSKNWCILQEMKTCALILACLPLVFLSSDLGSLELRAKARAMPLWKRQRGLGPRKTYTLWPRFLTATSHSSLFRHPLLSPLLCCQFQNYLYFPILSFFLNTASHKSPWLHSPVSHVFSGREVLGAYSHLRL